MEEKEKKTVDSSEDENEKKTPKKGKNVIDTTPTIDEEFEMLDEELSIVGRRKLARSARKNRRKLKFARRKRSKRKADNKRLTGRSRKSAIKTVRNKVAGSRGKKYSELSHSAKSVIDRRVAKRSKQIDRLARKNMPTQRRKDVARLRGEDYDINDAFQGEVLNEKKFHDMFTPDGKPKIDGRFKIFKTKNKRSADTQGSIDHLAKKVTESINLEQFKTNKYLKEKAKELGESYNLLKAIYEQGMDEWTSFESLPAEQYSMNKVYAYINEKYDESREEKIRRTALKMMAKLEASAPHEAIESHAFTVTRQFDTGMRPRELAKLYKELTKTAGSSPKAKSSLFDKYKVRAPNHESYMAEQGGAGQQGTNKLVNKYKKDTPGEDCGCDDECQCNESYKIKTTTIDDETFSSKSFKDKKAAESSLWDMIQANKKQPKNRKHKSIEIVKESVELDESYDRRVDDVAKKTMKMYGRELTKSNAAKYIEMAGKGTLELRSSGAAKKDFIKDVTKKLSFEKRDKYGMTQKDWIDAIKDFKKIRNYGGVDDLVSKYDIEHYDEEDFLDQLAKKAKYKSYLHFVADKTQMDYDMAVGNAFPDGDPVDMFAKDVMRWNVDRYDVSIVADYVAQNNGFKSHYAYLAAIWDDHVKDRMADLKSVQDRLAKETDPKKIKSLEYDLESVKGMLEPFGGVGARNPWK